MEATFTGIDTRQFEQVFKAHFKALHAYAITILNEEAMAEEIVQQVFFKLWEKRNEIRIRQSLKAYLYSSVYNHCMNYLKHEKVKQRHQHYIIQSGNGGDESAGRKIMLQELENKISGALNRLPQQCRTIFQMSRFEELKYREIAETLNLSVKTVENQMSKALRIMRKELEAYLPVFFIIMINF